MGVSRDKLFEVVVGVVLERNGYLASLPKARLKGRAADHQIDSIGVYRLQVPFVFPIRLVAEAKCYSRPVVGIEVVEKLRSIVDDLNQTLPARVQPPAGPEDTNCSSHYVGAVFSTNGFSAKAQEFACSHGVFCVELEPTVGGGGSVRHMSDWMDELGNKLRDLASERSCPNNCVGSSDSYDTLEKLVNGGLGQLDEAQRQQLLSIIGAILIKCPIFAGLWSYLSTLHLAVFGGNAVVISVSTEGWPLLVMGASRLAQRNAELGLSSRDGWRLGPSEFRPRIAVEGVEDLPLAERDRGVATVSRKRLVLSIAPFGDDQSATAELVLSASSLEALGRGQHVQIVIPVTETLVLSGGCRLRE
jgi:hypothetical protein